MRCKPFSFGISPYLMHRFGDWGTGRLGYFGRGLAIRTRCPVLPRLRFPTGGANAQTLGTTEQTAHFVTGDFMPFVQNAFDIDLMQTQTTIGTGVVDPQTGFAAANHATFVINPRDHSPTTSPIRSTAPSRCSCLVGMRIFTTPRRPSPLSGTIDPRSDLEFRHHADARSGQCADGQLRPPERL